MPIKVRPARKNTSRENRLEELGRVDAEKAYTSQGKRDLKDEKKRIIEDLKKRRERRREDPFPFDALSRKRRASGGTVKKAIKGAKDGVTKVVAPFTHTANAMKAGATKLIKGLPKIAKKGWK